MKHLVAILFLLIAAITTFTPCCTGEEDGATLSAMEASHHAQEGEDESCSPFSSCIACCFGFTLPIHTVSLPGLSLSRPRHRSGYGVPLLPELSFSFWQPPKANAAGC